MNRRRYWQPVGIVLGVAALTYVSYLFSPRRHVDHRRSGDLAPYFHVLDCKGPSEEREISYVGEVRLQRKFLGDQKPTDAEAAEAARAQVAFLAAGLKNDLQGTTVAELFPSLQAVQVSKVAISEGQYGAELKIDRRMDNPRSGLSERYVNAAMTNGQTRASDAAWIIRFEVSLSAGICWPGKSAQHALPMARLPFDPYLAYWYVPPKSRRPMRFFFKKDVVNPCIEPLGAELSKPSMYFYVWNPIASGRDADGKTYDCSKLLSTQGRLSETALKMHEARPRKLRAFLAGLLRPPKELRVTAIQGTAMPFEQRQGPAWLTQALDGKEAILKPLKAGRFEQLLPSRVDPAAFKFRSFLRKLDTLIRLESMSTEMKENSVLLEVKGALRQSGRKARFRIYFGPTAEELPGGAGHASEFKRALAEDDMIFYTGHSGMGRNLSLERLLGREELASNKGMNPKRYQLLGISSCRPNLYFGRDWMNSRKSHGLGGELYLQSTNSMNEKLSLSFIQRLDGIWARTAPFGKDYISPYTYSDERILNYSY